MDKSLFDKYHISRTTMLDAAVKYAEMGLAVFPLVAQGKEPATKHGLKDASSDPVKVREMFSNKPYSNIGMACGAQSGGIIVVDIDVDEEAGKDGHDSLRAWEREHGPLPDTAMTLTGRGGNHYLYRTSGATRSRIACKEGIDIRADGGYIVLPPSIHPNRTQYEWEHDLSEYQIVEATDTVISLMNEGVEVGKEFKVPDKIPSGERNGTLYKLACSMQARGNSDQAILAAVKAENDTRCIPPLEDTEIERIVSSALTKKKGTAPFKSDSEEETKETEPLDSYTFAEITGMDLKPPEFLVENILPKGVCLLGAPPKSGKSWMALDIAIQVSSGGIFLGQRCKQAGVLYLSLEDSWYRLMERTKKLQQGAPVSDKLHYAIMADKIMPGEDKGLCKQLDMELEKYPDVELVIIDTLQLVTPSKQRGDDAYASTYTMLNTIRPFWQDRGIGFLLIHHTRKKTLNDVDPFETFLGSQALTGATDAMYLINTKKDDDFSDFYGRGRDFEEVSLAICRDQDTCRWISLGTSENMQQRKEMEEYNEDPVVNTILKIVKQTNGTPHKFLLKELREQIAKDYGVLIGTTAKSFGTKVRDLVPKLYMYDGVVLKPLGHKTINGKNGTWYEVMSEENAKS